MKKYVTIIQAAAFVALIAINVITHAVGEIKKITEGEVNE